MDLCALLANVAVKKVLHYKECAVSGVEADSRRVNKGFLFVCLTGGKADGHSFAEEAKARGAVALVTEREIESDLPQFIVENSRVALAVISGNFYGNPASKLNIVTVVGTNGKTSTSDILSEIFSEAGYRTATIGTLGFKVDGNRKEGTLTTPDPIELNRTLAEMLASGVQYVFLEASAHAIYYHKLAGIKAKATIFTNLTQDHLDFFGTMERYAAVKLSYFTHENTALAVVNSDDQYGRKILLSERVPTISYGMGNPADVFAIDVEEKEDGLRFTINAFDQLAVIQTALSGFFNVYNIMAATAVAMYFGVSLKTVTVALRNMKPVPGRYEKRMIRGRQVVVDYAHTPDGLSNLLSAVKKQATGKVITVFGCGGDRDRSKRPQMGNIASRFSDFTLITDDNPRYEEEAAIAEEIKSGVLADSTCEVVLDRAEAILRAFELSSVGDTIVIAGKGHETTMEIKGRKIPYNDFEILEKLDR